MPHPSIGSQPIQLVKLDPKVSESLFETLLGGRAAGLTGSLLTWLHDDWYAVAPDARALLAAGGLEPDVELRAAGAIGMQTVDASAYATLLAMRSSVAPRSVGAAGTVVMDPPQFSWPATWRGQPVRVDWHLGAAGVPDAWDQLAGQGPGAFSGIRIGHIDTGYTPHPALGFGSAAGAWMLATEGKNFWKDQVDAPTFGEQPGAYDLNRSEYLDARDNHSGSHGGHGTRTAATMAGLWAPPGAAFPYFGAAPGANIVPYRITDSVFIDHVPKLLAQALRQAVSQGCQVITICLGALRASKSVASAIDHAYEVGVIICAAAGNVIREVIYPGRFNRVLTVGGATTPDGVTLEPWPGASRGPYVDVSAPADRIRRGTTVLKKERERFLVQPGGDGTSFATSLSSGIAVLWLARRGAELDALYGTERWARVAAFKRLIKQTASVPAGWDKANYGAGVVNAGRLLRAALPPLAELHHEAAAWEPFDPQA